jgi:hypothetical protein
LFYS